MTQPEQFFVYIALWYSLEAVVTALETDIRAFGFFINLKKKNIKSLKMLVAGYKEKNLDFHTSSKTSI